MDWNLYTDKHSHPSDSHSVEFVAYERREGGWDVFTFEPAGSCPELEDGRIDPEHIFLERIASSKELDAVAGAVMGRLGVGYRPSVFYRETGGRRMIGKVHSHLKVHGVGYAWVRSGDGDTWELVIRQKDFPLAEEMVATNV